MPFLTKYQLTIITPTGEQHVKKAYGRSAVYTRAAILRAWGLHPESRVESKVLQKEVWIGYNFKSSYL